MNTYSWVVTIINLALFLMTGSPTSLFGACLLPVICVVFHPEAST